MWPVGEDLAGAKWHRPVDRIGFAVVSNAIKRDHQNYLAHGGLGFILGDGRLNYGRENLVEAYYTWHYRRGCSFPLTASHFDSPRL